MTKEPSCIHRSGCPKPNVCREFGHCTSMTETDLKLGIDPAAQATVDRLTSARIAQGHSAALTSKTASRLDHFRADVRAADQGLYSDRVVLTCYAAKLLLAEIDAALNAVETKARLTNAQCDEVIDQLQEIEWSGITRDDVRTWDGMIVEARCSSPVEPTVRIPEDPDSAATTYGLPLQLSPEKASALPTEAQCSWGCHYVGDRFIRYAACTVHGASGNGT